MDSCPFRRVSENAPSTAWSGGEGSGVSGHMQRAAPPGVLTLRREAEAHVGKRLRRGDEGPLEERDARLGTGAAVGVVKVGEVECVVDDADAGQLAVLALLFNVVLEPARVAALALDGGPGLVQRCPERVKGGVALRLAHRPALTVKGALQPMLPSILVGLLGWQGSVKGVRRGGKGGRGEDGEDEGAGEKDGAEHACNVATPGRQPGPHRTASPPSLTQHRGQPRSHARGPAGGGGLSLPAPPLLVLVALAPPQRDILCSSHTAHTRGGWWRAGRQWKQAGRRIRRTLNPMAMIRARRVPSYLGTFTDIISLSTAA